MNVLLAGVVGIWVIICIYIAICAEIIGANEFMAVFRLGKEYKIYRKGLHFVWRPIQQGKRFPTEVIPEDFPGKPEKIQTEDLENLKPGHVKPIFIQHPSYKEALYFDPEKNELVPSLSYSEYIRRFPDMAKQLEEDQLSQAMTSEVDGTYMFNLIGDDDKDKEGNPIEIPIEQRKIFQFIRTVNSIDKAKSLFLDAITAMLQDIMGKLTCRVCNTEKARISERFQRELEIFIGERKPDEKQQKETPQDVAEKKEGEKSISTRHDHGEPWGVHLANAFVKTVKPPKRVSEQMADSAAGVGQRKEDILNAQAESEATRLQGEAKAAATKADGEATAHAITVVAKAMENPHAQAARLYDIYEAAAGNANFVMASEIAGLGGVIKNILKDNQAK